MPALVLNYFGQAAPSSKTRPQYRIRFFHGAPMVAPAAGGHLDPATITASQAVISGVFSVTTQAVSLGLSRACASNIPPPNTPVRLRAHHELDHDDRDPRLVVGFGSSAALAGAIDWPCRAR